MNPATPTRTECPGERSLAPRENPPIRHVRIGLIGAGKEGSDLFDLIRDWPEAELAVVIDPRPEAPGLARARALGIPTALQHLDVFAHSVQIVLEATGHQSVLEDLLRAKPAGVEVIGGGSLRLFSDLLQDKVTTARQLKAQVELAAVLESTLDVHEQLSIATCELVDACGVDRCAIFLCEGGTECATSVVAQFAAGQTGDATTGALEGLGKIGRAHV